MVCSNTCSLQTQGFMQMGEPILVGVPRGVRIAQVRSPDGLHARGHIIAACVNSSTANLYAITRTTATIRFGGGSLLSNLYSNLCRHLINGF